MGASRCHRAKDSPSLGIEPVRWQDLMNSNRGLATAGLQVEMHTIGSLAELCCLVSYFLLCSCCTHVISLHPPHSTVSPSTLCDFLIVNEETEAQTGQGNPLTAVGMW